MKCKASCHLFVCLANLELFSPVRLQWCNLEHSHAIVCHCRIFHTDWTHSILYMVIYRGISNDAECTHSCDKKHQNYTLNKYSWFYHIFASILTEWGLDHWQDIAVLFSCQHCFFFFVTIATHMWSKHCSGIIYKKEVSVSGMQHENRIDQTCHFTLYSLVQHLKLLSFSRSKLVWLCACLCNCKYPLSCIQYKVKPCFI